VHSDAEALFDLPQVLVKLAAESGEVAGVAGFQRKAELTGRFVAVQIEF
jgi:hypothetical protein